MNTNAAVKVSDHAVLRYIERVKGVDLEALRREIAALVGPTVQVGATKVYDGTFTYLLDRNIVVTVARGRTGANHSLHKANGATRPEGRR